MQKQIRAGIVFWAAGGGRLDRGAPIEFKFFYVNTVQAPAKYKKDLEMPGFIFESLRLIISKIM